MVLTASLGYPRIGKNRELKKHIEQYLKHKISDEMLLEAAKELRLTHIKEQSYKKIDIIPSNDFTLYDTVLDHAIMFGNIPSRYDKLKGLELYFGMARGLQINKEERQADVKAMEMKKWFDTNYHYIVPEFTKNQKFQLNSSIKLVNEYLDTKKELNIHTRPVIIGPISYLLLGKTVGDEFDRLDLLDNLMLAYCSLFKNMELNGIKAVQIDEPILCIETANSKSIKLISRAYEKLSNFGIELHLATYFSYVDQTVFETLVNLDVVSIHVDLVRGLEHLDLYLTLIKDNQKLSLGIIDGRNVWKAQLQPILNVIDRAVKKLGSDRVIIAPSCSLFLVPHSLEKETLMDSEVKSWLAFASEKIDELVLIKDILSGRTKKHENIIENNNKLFESKTNSPKITNQDVRNRVSDINSDMLSRKSSFTIRKKEQAKILNLPLFPTTTIGSFPQTNDVRQCRSKFKKGEMSVEQYNKVLKDKIKDCIKTQEDLGLDVLVHGEFERNDMVEFFGENFDGHVFTQNGWVQSYGFRCVKPPIIYGDVYRSKPITVEWSKYAKSLTNKPIKGMLTGPVTCLQWSFIRNDQIKEKTAFQLALAIRDEVKDLEEAGIPCIQIDEPAIREGLPLKKSEWKEYLQWAVNCFRLASSGVKDQTQIHTHMCYSDFNDIFTSIKNMDADVITIENSRSDLKLLSAFKQHSYTNYIGPGIYDIHSPRVPSVEEMEQRISAIMEHIDRELVWINPDCGLKTRGWEEVLKSLSNMVYVSKCLREKTKSKKVKN